MRKLLLVSSVLLIVFLVGCTSSPWTPPDVSSTGCEYDSDCVPDSPCMTSGCVNVDYADYLDRDPEEPLICHQMYIYGAASKESCVCQDNVCVNSKTVYEEVGCPEPVDCGPYLDTPEERLLDELPALICFEKDYQQWAEENCDDVPEY